MTAANPHVALRANPMNNTNPLKLGVFGQNITGGLVMTTAEGTVDGRWADQPTIALAADAAGYEFLLPVARWKGLNGPSRYAKNTLEVFTWAAAVAAITKQIGIFATAHVPLYHPLLAAKQGATIDEISGGRFGINIVAGWNANEFDMFGLQQRPHDERYEISSEWIEIVRQLWQTESVSYSGRFYTVRDAQVLPQPTRSPVLINAGVSPAGIRFAAKYMDFIFQGYPNEETFIQNVRSVKELARREFNREIGVLVTATIVCADTETEAKAYYDYYVEQKGDFESAEQLIGQLISGDNRSMSKEVFAQLQRGLVAAWGGIPLVGTPMQIADRLQRLNEIGVAGVALNWVNYDDGIHQFNEQIHPLLVAAGLRNSPRQMVTD